MVAFVKASHPFHRYCGCGALVWDSPTPGGIPRFSETVTCWNCGRDCSRKDAPGYQLWRVRRGWYLWNKRRRLAWRSLTQRMVARWQ